MRVRARTFSGINIAALVSYLTCTQLGNYGRQASAAHVFDALSQATGGKSIPQPHYAYQSGPFLEAAGSVVSIPCALSRSH